MTGLPRLHWGVFVDLGTVGTFFFQTFWNVDQKRFSPQKSKHLTDVTNRKSGEGGHNTSMHSLNALT